jgi:uncharacterized protein YbjT (DUF2867 family)
MNRSILMAETILVTGASGNVGREVVKQLLLHEKKVIAAKRPNQNPKDSTRLIH